MTTKTKNSIPIYPNPFPFIQYLTDRLGPLMVHSVYSYSPIHVPCTMYTTKIFL